MQGQFVMRLLGKCFKDYKLNPKFSGIRTVAACNAQKAEINRYSSFLQTGCSHGIRKAFFTALFSGLHLLLLFSSMGLIFWYGTKLTLEQKLSPGNV
jgi:ATP-binding cassette subfamily B (MDR/TAP) protein 1